MIRQDAAHQLHIRAPPALHLHLRSPYRSGLKHHRRQPGRPSSRSVAELARRQLLAFFRPTKLL